MKKLVTKVEYEYTIDKLFKNPASPTKSVYDILSKCIENQLAFLVLTNTDHFTNDKEVMFSPQTEHDFWLSPSTEAVPCLFWFAGKARRRRLLCIPIMSIQGIEVVEPPLEDGEAYNLSDDDDGDGCEEEEEEEDEDDEDEDDD